MGSSSPLIKPSSVHLPQPVTMSMILRTTNLILRKTLIPSSFTILNTSSFTVFNKSISSSQSISDLPPNLQEIIKLKTSSDNSNDTKLISDLPPNLQEIIKLSGVPLADPDRQEEDRAKELQEVMKHISDDLPPNLQQVIKVFSDMDSDLFEKKLLPYYYHTANVRPNKRGLPPLRDIYKTLDNKVEIEGEGCRISHIWVRAYLDPDDPDNKVWFEADFDGFNPSVNRALAGLLFHSLSGRPLAELTPQFFTLFQQCLTLTPSHQFSLLGFKFSNIGLLCMLKHMQKKCLLLAPHSSSVKATAGAGHHVGAVLGAGFSDLPANLQQVIQLFSDIQQDKHLFEKKLRPYTNVRILPSANSLNISSENYVQGCTSPIWIRAYLDGVDPDNKVWFQALIKCDITRALAGLLFQSLSGRPLAELTTHFFTVFQQSVTRTTPLYKNLLCMLKHMQKKCLLLVDFVEEEAAAAARPAPGALAGALSGSLWSNRAVAADFPTLRYLDHVEKNRAAFVAYHAARGGTVIRYIMDIALAREGKRVSDLLLMDELDTGFGSKPATAQTKRGG